MKKTAFITGINGQDGYYLAELLLAKNYEVYGLSRNNKNNNNKINYFKGDLTDTLSIKEIFKQIKPDEIYNLASQSHTHKSWQNSIETAQINALGAHNLFDLAFENNPDCKIFQASSSQMFNATKDKYHTENTAFNPSTPYAAAKLYAHNIANLYRCNQNKFISCGILYNHESPMRGMHFITQKVTYAAACIKNNIFTSKELNENNKPIVKNGKLDLGNLNSIRDWGHAEDYVKAMWMILQHNKSDNFIIATGISHSIKELCETAFSYLNLDWKKHISIDTKLIRSEHQPAKANIFKIKDKLGWEPEISFKKMIECMVEFHLKKLHT
ncbi:GDP-mannose 4,6-dehydratase [Gammaproteobacteria bacterium]|nr:GDP-mannose 4,6-dehydratase [Gammaproteobacteria bacterium]